TFNLANEPHQNLYFDLLTVFFVLIHIIRKCDFVCDCSDCADEQNCGYSGKSFECDFEDDGVCGWTIESSGGSYTWQRDQSGDRLPDSGPSSDYTTGTATVGAESLQSHTGLGSTPLWASVLHQGSQEAVVWRPEASSIRSWREATVFLGRISSPFRIRLHSARSEGQKGDVAVDQLEFLDCALPLPPPGTDCSAGTVPCGSGGCVEQRQLCDGTDDCGDDRLLTIGLKPRKNKCLNRLFFQIGNSTLEKFPRPPKHPCIDDPAKMCDFQADCAGAEDEAKCGDFSYAEGSSGWTDTSVGSQEYLYVAEAAGQQLTEAQTWTPLLGPTGPACNLSFDFSLTGSLEHIVSWPTGLSCNFEEGLCGWYQDNSDDFDWSVVTGMDHTVGIGETVQNNHFLKVLFILFYSFFFNHNSSKKQFTKCFTTSIEEICMLICMSQIRVHGSTPLFFFCKKSDCMINTTERKHGTPLKTPVVLQQLSIEAVRSGFDGQVAIDDVTFLDGPCALPRKCSFEGQKCGYSSYGAVRWLHRSGRTTTANGPKTDHTLGTELGYYMMVNADADILPAGQTTVLASPVQKATFCQTTSPAGGRCLSGYLTVYMKPEKGERVPIFSESLNQGDDWRHGQGNVSSGLVDWQVPFTFEVVGSGSRGSHVAVDDISVSAHPCEDQASKCSLENGMCNWSNIQNNERDKLDWELTSPEAERHYPVPPEDHTLGTEKGHFLFFPSSNRTPANENAWLLSSHLPPTQATCLRFWAYKLHSFRFFCVRRIMFQLTVNELGEPWRHFELNITSREEYQIVFEGIKGTSGFLALDDIEYTVGFDCATRVTEPRIMLVLLLYVSLSARTLLLRNESKSCTATICHHKRAADIHLENYRNTLNIC
uniref:MAM domain-containing protein n=1 Tax=Fundulus heteroclitus TaxID=8078 RepID=A0A3Q2TEF9_FUNHE